MDQLVRHIAARYKIKLSDEEVRQIALDAAATEVILRPLYEIDLGQIRPAMGIVKKPYPARRTRGAK